MRPALIAAVGLAGLAFAAAPVAAAASGGHAAKLPNVCKLTGVSAKLARSILGRHATIGLGTTTATTPPNLGTYCILNPGVYPKGSLDDELFHASDYLALTAEFSSGGKVTKLKHLGKGAVYVLSSDHGIDDLLFRTTRYSVVLDNSLLGGQPRSDYPTEKQYVKLARAVYKHLQG